MRSSFPCIALSTLLILSGCHSAYVAATISNHTAEPLSLIELDYPSASFGKQALAPGEDFHYRFKVIGSGPTALLWTDASRHDHKSAGPSLRDGDEGHLTVTFTPLAAPIWNLQLINHTPSS
jgi:hypothetical protein